MFAGNRKVYDGLLIAGLSIVKHCTEPITVYVLTMDLSDINSEYKDIDGSLIARLDAVYKRGNKNSKVIRIDVRDLYLLHLNNSPNSESFYTPYALLRLLAEDITQIPSKVLYLDADIVANDNISELFNIDIHNYEIAGVRDFYGRFFFYPNYLNSGVLLMNMDKIRQTKLLSRSLKLCQSKRVFLPDQTAINKYARKKLILPSKFNEQKKLSKDTVIRHFSMTIKFFPKFKTQNIKPWHIDKVHSVLKLTHFDDVLEEYQNIIKEMMSNLNYKDCV
jgi:lipopolysaccharide biosynthesis glycosyltransferase